ncbi:MAG: hypothetical protein CSB24_07480 [Deltaproteobacteria bacterium]|nr:MAG: hypothetical protein CSB24_07480 [Deltaproteobacteria bacterium]
MADNKRLGEKLTSFAMELWREGMQTVWILFRITIPVIIITKLFTELGLIVFLTGILEPVMGIMGLPGELGLVWATGMITTIYGALAVFASLAPSLDLTAAQVTVLGGILLIAHSLPVELGISKKAGAPILPILFLRLGGAVVYGTALAFLCRYCKIWQEPAVIYFKETAQDTNLLAWAGAQLVNLGMMVAVIFAILLAMKILQSAGIIGLLEKMLNPVLPWFGMSSRAAPMTVVGMLIGLSYGGALIIRETTLGKLGRNEIFNSMALMALCHALIEDTLLMIAIGGMLAGLLFGRIIFALAVTFLIARLVSRFLQTGNKG